MHILHTLFQYFSKRKFFFFCLVKVHPTCQKKNLRKIVSGKAVIQYGSKQFEMIFIFSFMFSFSFFVRIKRKDVCCEPDESSRKHPINWNRTSLFWLILSYSCFFFTTLGGGRTTFTLFNKKSALTTITQRQKHSQILVKNFDKKNVIILTISFQNAYLIFGAPCIKKAMSQRQYLPKLNCKHTIFNYCTQQMQECQDICPKFVLCKYLFFILKIIEDLDYEWDHRSYSLFSFGKCGKRLGHLTHDGKKDTKACIKLKLADSGTDLLNIGLLFLKFFEDLSEICKDIAFEKSLFNNFFFLLKEFIFCVNRLQETKCLR
ncbi:hypothetical protein RFI_05075 [Reticulomyxa filosa]|uniref:Uncharacterized protein n=1 Tax=Reticulomyxa filosa TaxID=46433 RepID=X6P1M5_RETFI|nr:hypothetical protein RFI_05075 [Reticulomyxa filosa]|eukprot:ETO32043.1 hypothetical protein RFI_05075 [Reticulomyxa filosa]